MFDFVQLKYYYDLYMYFALFLVLANLLHAYTLKLDDSKNIRFLRTVGLVLLVGITLYLGLRPLGRYFGDMGAYHHKFLNYAQGADVTTTKDVFFHYYMKFLSNFVPSSGFFLITEILYIIPMYLISKKHFKQYWFYAFFMFVVSFSFYSYGTNGIRNGVAGSMFLLGLCFPQKKILQAVFFLIGILFHKTVMLPVLAYCLTLIYNDPKTFLKGWLFAIPMSLIMGGIWISLFTSLGFGDDRLAGYLSGDFAGETPRFRWDFIFHSAFAVFAGWYFVIKRQFKDDFYNQILNTYLICNGFWILVIRANFSNRFAYLSWFMMGLVIIYPLLKKQFFKNQQVIIAKVVTAYFLFTFLMWLLYYS
ncbi:MAG: EpsG family protein [Flavobacteriaceae bacterium]|nr:EpsG family protein [Flavobacteriaceae bacterium]